MAISTIIEQQKCEGHEKRGRLVVLELEFKYRISQRNKKKTFFLIQFSQIGLIMSKSVNQKLF